MDYVARFIDYATRFERAFETDTWGPVAECFAESAIYEVPFPHPLGGSFQGPRAITAYLRAILDGFDRRFATRTPELLGLQQSGQDGCIVEIRGRVTYTHPDVPDLVFELDEVAHFEQERMVRLEDHYGEDTQRRMLEYIAGPGAAIGMLQVPEPTGA